MDYHFAEVSRTAAIEPIRRGDAKPFGESALPEPVRRSVLNVRDPFISRVIWNVLGEAIIASTNHARHAFGNFIANGGIKTVRLAPNVSRAFEQRFAAVVIRLIEPPATMSYAPQPLNPLRARAPGGRKNRNLDGL